MSVDPLAGAGAAELAALVDAELATLAANGDALQALAAQSQGAVLQARVLASNGLTDLLEIAGLRVAAALPPTVRPGDLLLVQVTGTADNGGVQLQIVANEGAAPSPPTPTPIAQNPLPPIVTTPIVTTAPIVTTPIIPPAATPAPSARPAGLSAAGQAIVPNAPPVLASAPAGAPPPSASASSSGAPAPPPSTPLPPLMAGALTSARVVGTQGRNDVLLIDGRRMSAVLPQPTAVGTSFPVRIVTVDGSRVQILAITAGRTEATAPLVGARLLPDVLRSLLTESPARSVSSAPQPPSGTAAGRAAVPPPATTDEAGPTVQPPTGTAGVPVRGPVVDAGPPTSIEARLAASRATALPPEPAAVGETPPPAPPAPPPLGRPAVPTVPTSRFVPPITIGVRPVPTAVPATAAAAIAASTPPKAVGLSAYTEPVALLRALRLPVTPSNVAAATLALDQPERLPQALAALENALPRASDDPHVATLRALLGFVGRIDPRSPTLSAQIAAYVDHVVTGGEPKLALLLAATDAAEPAAAPLAAAMAVERAAALDVDLKSTLLALAADTAAPTPALGSAIAGALTALTAVQANAAQALAARPDGFAFMLPLATPNGTANASISVRGDGGSGRSGTIDNANFHIAFVLETANFGTVAIDLITVNREVSVDVRAEAAPAVRAFRDALGHLTNRLEALHYRVSSAEAKLASTATIGVAAPPTRPVDPDATVDRSA
jgi:hypothetical protein